MKPLRIYECAAAAGAVVLAAAAVGCACTRLYPPAVAVAFGSLVLAEASVRERRRHQRAVAEAEFARRRALGDRPAPLTPCCLLALVSRGQAHDHKCTITKENSMHDPMALDQQEEQAAPVDWEAVARRREHDLKALGEQKRAAEQERDGAYRERNTLVALLAAYTSGAVVAPAPDVAEPGWQIVYLYPGGRQASWHAGPRDADLLQALEHVPLDDPRAQWDGHTTTEKYARLTQLTAELLARCGPDCAEAHTETGRCETARNR
ncbi:hypothetical protein ACIP68_22945 [Streptomyces griseoviridis]